LYFKKRERGSPLTPSLKEELGSFHSSLPPSIALLSFFLQEPLVETVEYVSVARKDTMEEMKEEVRPGDGAIISLALRLGKVRLIDNVIL